MEFYLQKKAALPKQGRFLFLLSDALEQNPSDRALIDPFAGCLFLEEKDT